MKHSDKSEDVLCQTFKCYVKQGDNSCWKMWPGFVDFPNFAQGFGFASREAIAEAREFSKTHQVGCC